jgi:hypothetical protein
MVRRTPVSRNPARLSEEKKEKKVIDSWFETHAVAAFKPKRMCEHYYCRCMMAAQLAAMDMLDAAIEVHFKQVPCRVKEDQ